MPLMNNVVVAHKFIGRGMATAKALEARGLVGVRHSLFISGRPEFVGKLPMRRDIEIGEKLPPIDAIHASVTYSITGWCWPIVSVLMWFGLRVEITVMWREGV